METEAGCTESAGCAGCSVCSVCTWPKQPPAVVLVGGAAAVVAEALGLVVAGFAVHVEAVVGTVRGRPGAVLGQVAVPSRRSAHTSCLFELRGDDTTDRRAAGLSGGPGSTARCHYSRWISHCGSHLPASAGTNQG